MDSADGSHTDMFADELPTRMPTYVPTRIDLVPAIVPPIFFNRETNEGKIVKAMFICTYKNVNIRTLTHGYQKCLVYFVKTSIFAI